MSNLSEGQFGCQTCGGAAGPSTYGGERNQRGCPSCGETLPVRVGVKGERVTHNGSPLDSGDMGAPHSVVTPVPSGHAVTIQGWGARRQGDATGKTAKAAAEQATRQLAQAQGRDRGTPPSPEVRKRINEQGRRTYGDEWEKY